jgi:hypothetical protein
MKGHSRLLTVSEVGCSAALSATICPIPKLIVRVRFPSPAPRQNARSTASCRIAWAPHDLSLVANLSQFLTSGPTRSRAEERGDGVPSRFEVARPDPHVVLERGRAAVSVPGPRGHHRDRHLTRVEQVGQRGVASVVEGDPAERGGLYEAVEGTAKRCVL